MKILDSIPASLEGLSIVKDDGQIAVVSLLMTGIRYLFRFNVLPLWAMGLMLGLSGIILNIVPSSGGEMSLSERFLFVGGGILLLSFSAYFVYNILIFYSRGLIVSSKHDVVLLPAFGDDSIMEYFYRLFPKRRSIKLSEVKKMHGREEQKMQRRLDNEAPKKYMVYELALLGDFGSVKIEFDTPAKREETRSAIKEIAKDAGTIIEDELHMRV
jgi:hypothetical protein